MWVLQALGERFESSGGLCAGVTTSHYLLQRLLGSCVGNRLHRSQEGRQGAQLEAR